MKPEKREIVLASVLGLLAGPCYILAGPERFLIWYAVVLGGGIFSTAHWLRDLKPSRSAWFTWLAWPVVMLTGAAVSLLVCGIGQKFLERW
ncbi:hypothetical protein Desku_1607 [Desulfofundulus kuznetsovii DSM 6115]|uniref:Uncharacterized protein n=1 Tax=Desulfofundulus kuznetsovii (strain DSM 6115 / VKM B-1805 / 17) TaxID=760568 RepID=A0AAU8PHJ5_DESK7|nr:hypothetical protein Desku_1607 [Desulfofundulus kuznetsovii DSM 6115]